MKVIYINGTFVFKKIHLTFTQSVKPDQLLSCLLITIRLALSHVKLLHC